jgi:hypothetical protein
MEGVGGRRQSEKTKTIAQATLTTLIASVDDQERIRPMAWDENGSLVPMDEAQLERQLALASESAKANPPLPENPILSFWDTTKLVLLDVARLMDRFFWPRNENLPFFLTILPPLVFLTAVTYVARGRWLIPLALVAMLGGFRFWVWYAIEHPRRNRRGAE